MNKLSKGLVEFKKQYFKKHKQLFESLSTRQNPHTLFIGCSDSRVIPNIITKTLPGELFVVRNIANIIPVYQPDGDNFLSIVSSIEFAVKNLNVENIVVCGHSNCGGCSALYLRDKIKDDLPATNKWISLSANVIEQLSQLSDAPEADKKLLTEQMNIVQQTTNLLTYPYVKEKYAKNELNIYGWYYIIETGDVFCYNFDESVFKLIN